MLNSSSRFFSFCDSRRVGGLNASAERGRSLGALAPEEFLQLREQVQTPPSHLQKKKDFVDV